MRFTKQQAHNFLTWAMIVRMFLVFQIEWDDAEGFDAAVVMDYVRQRQVLEINSINSDP